MSVRDYQLRSAQPAAHEIAEKVGPKWLGFTRSGGNAQHLSNSVSIDADGEYHRNGNDAAGLSNLYISSVDPKIWPIALDRSIQECVDTLVDLGA